MTARGMLRAALGYVDSGWPIVPGATPYGRKDRQVQARRADAPESMACSCGHADCPAPAAHPRDGNWLHHVITSPEDAQIWWGGQSGYPPNIVLVCGDAFDAWSVPHAVGARALDLLPDDIAPFLPIAMTPTERWHLFTAPALPDERPQIPPGLDILHLGAGQYVPAPPSTRGAHGHDSWLGESRRSRLPSWPPVAAALIRATEQLEHRQAARRQAAAR